MSSQLPTAQTRTAQATESGRTTATEPARTKATARVEPSLILERYRLHRRLGTGGFGTVWLARDERLERDVALKILPRERIVGGRFEREARAAARLSHPGIVTLYEAAVDDDGAYLVSELVRGETLDRLLDEGRLADSDIARIAIALCDALNDAHSHGIVHRDVKPSNILVPDHPASPAQLAKLTDFGVARVIGGKPLTMTGDVIGTAAYMAPEQAEGLEAGATADLYSLALVIYEALTGINPVRTGTAAQRARRLGAYLPPLRRQRRDLPQGLGRAIDQALRPRPRERGTLAELRAVLAEAVPLLEDTPGIVTSPWPIKRRSPEHDPPPDAARWGEHGEKLDVTRWGEPGETLDAAEQKPGPLSWSARGLAALAAAALCWWISANVLTSPLAPPALALTAAVAVAALPRVGWAALTVFLVAACEAQQLSGAALVIALGALLPVVLVPRRGEIWGLAAGAPALAALGIGGGWPALAARAAGPWRRAALGATGWVWLVLASPLSASELYIKTLPGNPPLHAWDASVQQAVTIVLRPIVTSGVLAGAPVWALAALVLPWLMRGQSRALRAAAAVGWSVLLVAGTGIALQLAHPGSSPISTQSALIGATAAALIAFAASLPG